MVGTFQHQDQGWEQQRSQSQGLRLKLKLGVGWRVVSAILVEAVLSLCV